MNNYSKSHDLYIQKMHEKLDQMNSFLRKESCAYQVKDRLSDQLKWLQFQVKYCLKKGNFTLLEENFNWVASNFNHDLKLDQTNKFTYLREYTNG